MVGGNGGVTANGSAMNLTTSNPINTSGVAAAGQIVQSIGGGGGVNAMTGDVVASGTPFNLFIGGNNSGGAFGGSGSTVQYSNTGSVTTTGDNAIGVIAQSIGR